MLTNAFKDNYPFIWYPNYHFLSSIKEIVINWLIVKPYVLYAICNVILWTMYNIPYLKQFT